MRDKRGESRVLPVPGEDVEAALARPGALSDDPLRRTAAEIDDGVGDDLPPERRDARIRISAHLIVDDCVHHPDAVVARRITEAVLQVDRGGYRGVPDEEHHFVVWLE